MDYKMKCHTFTRNPFQRTILSNDDEDVMTNPYESIVLKKDTKNRVSEIHESILHNIIDFMTVNDLVAFKQSCKLANAFIDQEQLLQRMIEEDGLTYTFCRCIYNNHHEFVDELIVDEQIPIDVLIKCMIYCVFTRRNDMVFKLLQHIHLNECNVDGLNVLPYKDDCPVCEHLPCFAYYVECVYDCDNAINYGIISDKALLRIACIADNVDIVNHLLKGGYTYCTPNDINLSVMNLAGNVVYYLIQHWNQKISFNTIRDFISTIYQELDWKFLKYLIDLNAIRLSKRLSYTFIHLLSMKPQYTKHVHDLVEQYGTNKLLDKLCMYYMSTMDLTALNMLMEQSKRLRVKPRLFRIIDNDDDLSKNVRLESFLLNRYILSNRNWKNMSATFVEQSSTLALVNQDTQ